MVRVFGGEHCFISRGFADFAFLLCSHYLLTIFSLFLVKVVATLQSCPRNAGHVRLVQEPPQVRSPKMLGDQFLLIKFNQIHIIYISLMHFEGSVESQASYGSSSLLEHWSWVDCRHSSSTS